MSDVATDREQRTPARPGRIDWLWLLGVGALVLTVAVSVAVFDLNGPLVVGDLVPRRSHLVGALLGLGLLALSASWLMRLRPYWDERVPPKRGLLRRIAVGALTCCCVLAGVLAFLWTALSDSVRTYTVLSPASANGCRVVVGEHSFLLLGSGDLYVLPAGAHLPRKVNSYFADDGYRPITFQTYRMAWHGEVAEVSIWGTRDQPVSYTPEPLPCG